MTPAERAEYDQIQDLENLYARRSGAGAFADIESAYSRTGTTGNAADMARKELLYDYGIPGIKYRDAGSRGTEGGTRNFVVFDENLVEIVRKYGIAGAAAMLGMSASQVEAQLNGQQQQQSQGLLGNP